MRGKLGVAVLLMATAAWLVAESQAEAGRRHHRRGYSSGCGYSAGCYSGCNTGYDSGCTTGCETAAPCNSGCGGTGDVAPQPPTADTESVPLAPEPDAGANAPAQKEITVGAAPQRVYSYQSARGRRWFRR